MNTTIKSNAELIDFCFNGLQDQWGYGMKRMYVSPPRNIACPYGFQGFGYKRRDGRLFIGLRMLVDQNSPVKFRLWSKTVPIMDLWGEIMVEFIRELHK